MKIRRISFAFLVCGAAGLMGGSWSCSSDDPVAGTGAAGGAGGSAQASVTNSSQVSSSSGVMAATCEGYCAAVEDHCTGEQTAQQYIDGETCLAVCAVFPAGEPGRRDTAQKGNNLECRNYWGTGPADTNLGACLAAGPTGGDTCGDECENFCFLAAAFCPDAYDDEDACIKECVAFPDVQFEDPSFNTNTYQSGDTYMCRMNQVLKASLDAEANCPNIVEDSALCSDGEGGAGGGGGAGGAG